MSLGLWRFLPSVLRPPSPAAVPRWFLAPLIVRQRSSSSNTKSNKPKKMEELRQNPYFDKYANKLMELQKTNPDEFLKKVEENKIKKTEINSTQPEPLPTSPPTPSRPVYNKQVQLKDIMKTELLDGQSVEVIRDVWTTYHKNKPCFLAAVAPTPMYEAILTRSREFPVFLFPVPRSGGYEFFVVEFRGSECFFTQLLSFQTRREDSPACLSIIHFTEYKEQGIVLMRGEYDDKVLNALEVQCLLNQMQLYYGTEDKEKLRLLESFTKHPEAFRHMDLVAEVENSFAVLK